MTLSNMKYFLISILGFLLTPTLFASTNPEQVKKVAQEILDKLYETNGDYRINAPKPRIRISNEIAYIAAFYPNENLIEIEIKAYEICQKLDEHAMDAFAFIIGHELGHHFQEVVQKSGLGTNYKSLLYDEEIETAADIFGVFCAYLSGYKSIQILPQLMDALYQDYNLSNCLGRYPCLKERREIARKVVKKVDRLAHIYEGANYLTAIGKPYLAGRSYDYLLNDYQGSEVYNNKGVNLALHAMNISEEKVDKYVYPLQLDWLTQLNIPKGDGAKSLSERDQKRRQHLLLEARQALEASGKRNPNYFLDKINLLCVESLLSEVNPTDYDPVKYYEKNHLESLINKLDIEKKRKKHLRLTLQLTKAIVYAKSINIDHQTKAKEWLGKLSKDKDLQISLIAKYNLAVLNTGEGDFSEDYAVASIGRSIRWLCDYPEPFPFYDEILLNPNETAAWKRVALSIQIEEGCINYIYRKDLHQFTIIQRQVVPEQEQTIFQIEKQTDKKPFHIIPITSGKIIVFGGATKSFIRLDNENRILEKGKYYFPT